MVKQFLEDLERFYPVILNLIKDGNIKKEWLADLYSIFNMEDSPYITPLKFHLYSLLVHHPEFLDYKLLSEKLNLSEDEIYEIFVKGKQAFEVYFPVYLPDEEEAHLYKALIVEGTSKTFTFNKFVDLQTIKAAANKDFFVIFSNYFTGDSYQFSIVAGLIAKDKNILKNLAFTGKVSSSGKILPVNHVNEKEKITKANEKNLITPDDISTLEELEFWLNSSQIPVILINRNTDNNIKESLNQIETLIKQDCPYFTIKNLIKFYNLSEEDLYIITPSIDFSNREELLNILKQFEERLEKLFSVRNSILYISLSVASLGFLVGSLIGARKKVVILHYQGEYRKAIDMSKDPRVIKENVKEYSIIQPESCNTDQEIALILNIASHNPVNFAKSYIEKNLPHVKSTCVINTIYGGNIPLEEFLTISRELYTYINTIKDKIHLFYSIPVPISISLGMAIAHFKDITLYHYDSKNTTYIKIPINLNEVISKF
ncbi:SAVED domain-containing protein [Sulfurihydrogenibium azorense]|uniref:SAVED domain-containing protein n=1 Tax=Sulfurihydrogenibium azorense TaxID=309806 RepID=UPI00391965FE